MFPELSFGRVIEGCFGALGKAISDWQARSVGRVSILESAPSEAPSTKAQAPEKFQISITKPRKQIPAQAACRSVFELGASCFFGAWSLECGAFCPGFQFSKN